jgi:uncharacterized protein YyaL (SSP411 family)
VNSEGLWEHGNYILLRKKTDGELSSRYRISAADLQKKISSLKKKVLAEREKRVRPGLDDKSLTSWNALMIKGYSDAYLVFGEKKFLDAALKNAEFILKKQLRVDGSLYHSYKNGKSTVTGFLEDYCFTIEAFISLYECTFDEQWLTHAKQLADYCLAHFHDKNSVMFYFTSDSDKPLIARKMEVTDNVIPASNSSLAKSLYLLGLYLDNSHYLSISEQMLNNVKADIPSYGSGYSNWAILMLNHVFPFYEIAIVGNDVDEMRGKFSMHYIPHKIFVGSKTESRLPLLQNKFVEGKTMIYVCRNKTCKLPVTEAGEALKQIE